MDFSPHGNVLNYILEVKNKMEFVIRKFVMLSLEMWDYNLGE